MITQENLIYAFRNLMNRKVRSSLTILSIFVGIATIFIFISFGWGLYYYVDSISSEMGIDKVFIQAKGMGAPGMDNTFKLEDKDLNAVEKTRGVLQATGMEMSSVKISSNNQIKYAFSAGMPVNDEKQMHLMEELSTFKVDVGRQLQKGDDDKVVLGHNYMIAEKFFTKPLKMGDKVEINDLEFKIIGFYEEVGNPSDDSNIYLTPEAFRTVTGRDYVSYAMLVAKVDNVDNIDETIDRIERRLRYVRGLEEGKEDFSVESAQQMIEAFGTTLNIVVGFIIMIALISVLVSAINTANTMFTSILERTKEIGVMKAIGATNSEILTIFLIESSILGLAAGIIGVAVGAFLSILGGQILTMLGWSFLQPYMPWKLFLGCILFAGIVGTISGLIPAYNASKKSPVESLRYE